jgi:RND family efflux transporter MFP subunit
MSQKNKFIKIIIPIIVIAIGVAIMFVLSQKRSEPKKEVRTDPGILVQTIEAVKQDKRIIVKGTGTVKASQEVSVVPQVSGRITYISPQLVVGGLFNKGDTLFKVEAIDYVLGLEKAKAARAKAEYDLATIEGRARVARSEWQRLNRDTNTEPNPLVLYGPQTANAKASLASAQAAVDQAQLALDRTEVKAPFNSRVKSENIDIGQYVKSGNSIAMLAGTDAVEIEVPLTLENLHWLNIPLHGKTLNGPDAVVSVINSGSAHEWKGHVLRSTGEVNPKSRMMEVIIEVRDPYELSNQNNSERPALAIGTFVDAQIKGRTLKGVFVIPRTTYRDDSTVWLIDKENKLRIQEVAPVRIEKNEVIIRSGLSEGDQIIVTNIAGAANGMKLRGKGTEAQRHKVKKEKPSQ